MRWFYLCVITLFVVSAIIFAAQNVQVVTISFLGYSAHMPLAFLIVGIYLLGAATGCSLLSLLRRSFEGARPRAPFATR